MDDAEGAGLVLADQVAAVVAESAELAWVIAAAIDASGVTPSEWLERMRETRRGDNEHNHT